MSATKIGRNEQCPCGSGAKFKRCCEGKTDWGSLERAPLKVAARHMTVRGKNIVFLGAVLNALQIDKDCVNKPFSELKRAVSPDVVTQVFSIIPELWPDLDDFERALEKEKVLTTALYTGSYEPEFVFRAITRLSLYCDKILLVDPFIRAEGVRPQFNPLEHPDQHRSTTIKFLFLWITLWPWIDAGVVSFVRPLHDFVPGLWHEVISLQRKRVEENPKLKRILDLEVKERMGDFGPFDRGFGEISLLSMPDKQLLEMIRGVSANNPLGSEKRVPCLHKEKARFAPLFRGALTWTNGGVSSRDIWCLLRTCQTNVCHDRLSHRDGLANALEGDRTRPRVCWH